MTHKDSICISCRFLNAYTNAIVFTGKGRSLISECHYGGINAGDRKNCKRFEKASEKTIKERLKCITGDDE